MLLEKICKELGVEIGEIWAGSDGFRYCIFSDGNIERDEGEILENYMTLNAAWKDIISGQLKPIWKPQIGDHYWTVDFEEEDKVYQYAWYNGETENRLSERGLIFKTKEKAMKVANKMLEALREE